MRLLASVNALLLAGALLSPPLAFPAMGEEAAASNDAAFPDREAIAQRVRRAGETARKLEADGLPAAVNDSAGEDALASADDERHAGGGDAASTPGEWPTRRPPMPYEIVRSLQFLQDQIARGNDAAIRLQASLLRRFGPALLAAEPEIWNDRRNLRAAALFVLSGGPPAVLRGIIERAQIADEDKNLLKGSLAYVENRMADAQAILSGIDLDRLEPALAAQLGLALGQLKQESDPAGALADLARARLLMPGSLIDEAALRMGVLIANDVGDTQEADRLARRYFDRYARSVYAGNFRARFAAVYAERAQGTEAQTIALIADLTSSLDDADRLGIYLAVARRALVRGNLKLADGAAQEALTIEGASAEDRHRALLYAIASTLTQKSPAEATATLNAIDPERLHPADMELRDAAYSVLQGMRAPIDPGGLAAPDDEEASVRSELQARGERLLNQISNDLKSLDP